MHFQSPQWTEHRLRVVTHEALKIRIVRLVIGNPQAAPRIHILNAMAIPPKSANQFCHTLHGGRKRIDVGNLRSDMHADAGNLQISAPGSLLCRSAAICRGLNLLLRSSRWYAELCGRHAGKSADARGWLRLNKCTKECRSARPASPAPPDRSSEPRRQACAARIHRFVRDK